MTDEEKLTIMRERWPDVAADEARAKATLRAVLVSGDGSRVPEGVQAMADLVDARVMMLVSFDVDVQLRPPE